MSAFFLLLSFVFLFECVRFQPKLTKMNTKNLQNSKLVSLAKKGMEKSVSLKQPAVKSHYECETCIGFINQALNNLLQIIEQIGIGGGCSAICGMLRMCNSLKPLC